MEKHLKKLITDSPEFDFRMEDIVRLRREFATLIDNLSDQYKEKEKKRKRKKWKEKQSAVGTDRSNKGGEFV